MEDNECMLTTFDNPYNPFEDFDSWFMFDVEKGYNTCSHLSRIVDTMTDDYYSNDLTQQEQDELIERAIDRIIELDFMQIYKKVYKNNNDNDKTDTSES